jgi:dienelactone hydrolase
MRITLPTGTPAELARPSTPVPTGDVVVDAADAADATGTADAPARGLVILPDIMGLRPLFDDHAQRLADAIGGPVCAVEPWPGRESLTFEERLGSVGTLVDASVVADAMAAADATGASRVGVLGFCMGGMYTLKLAASGRFDRAVAFYGMIRVPDAWLSPTQAQPLDLLAGGHCPTLAIIGSVDVWTPPDDVASLRDAGVEVVVYEGAEHGFVHDPDRPAHRAADAADAWDRALAFLAA